MGLNDVCHEEKELRYRNKDNKKRGTKRAVALSALVIAFGSGSLLGVKTLEHNRYLREHTVNIESSLYADSVSLEKCYADALKKNKEFQLEVDARNEKASEELLACASVSSTEVASMLPNFNFGGYNVYTSEASQNEVVEGIENLLDKYSPYLYYYGKRNDLNAECLYVLETECVKWGLDPYVMLGVIMTESGGNASATNSKSTARGFCQILSGTGKSIYEDTLGHGKGTYNHNMAFNPETNLRMGVALLGSLQKRYGLYNAIQRYRGKSDISGYVASINKYMGMSGKHLPF